MRFFDELKTESCVLRIFGILIYFSFTGLITAQQSIDKITIEYENKKTYFVYDTTVVNPKKVIKDDNLIPWLVLTKGTLVIDLKNKELSITKMEKGTEAELEEITYVSDIDSYVQKGNLITYYKKGITWDGMTSRVTTTVNIKKGSFEQITYTPDNYQNITKPIKIIRFELN